MANISYRKNIHIIGGGTTFAVRAHLSISALAYGTAARMIARMCGEHPENELNVNLHLTRMANAGQGTLETNQDVAALIDSFVADPATKIIFFSPALVDFSGQIGDTPSGKYAERLKSRESTPSMVLTAEPKILPRIRRTRKDITLVAFKTTTGATENEQYIAGLRLLKESSANLVLANDLVTRTNMIITPEEARYHVTTNREEALRNLVDMAIKRSHLTFTRSTVVAAEAVPWQSEQVPTALRTVVDYCIGSGAYKPFNGATVGHFATKVDGTTFLTSRRKTNFNDLEKLGLVKIVTDGPDTVIAYGSRPSVGGQSQRIIFTEHDGFDCIVHFHCPLKVSHLDDVPVVSQREYECGSHECGRNTSQGLKQFGNLLAVMLDNHGPNIVFKKDVSPGEVIAFIERNFDLAAKTGGPVA
jgi:hypothetical protein